MRICWFLALLTVSASAQQQQQQQQQQQPGLLSINSPRSSSSSSSASSISGGEAKPDGKSNSAASAAVLVKLPSDLEAVLNLQKSDRSRIHASILGLPPENAGTHLGRILEDDGDAATTTSRVFAIAGTTTTTAATVSTSGGSASSKRPSVSTTVNSLDKEELIPPAKGGGGGGRSFWSIAWEAHVYFSGTLFVLLALYCTVNILRLHTFSRLFSRGYFVALNLCLILLGGIRPVYLFHDPYNEAQTLPRMMSYLLLDTGFPCITTAFAVLFLALLRATQIELVSPGFQTPRSLALFCLAHFAISIGVDVAIGLVAEARYLVLLCQGFFIVWSLLLSAGYFYIFAAMKKVAMRSHGDMMRTVYPKLAVDGTYCDQVNTVGGSRPPLARAVTLTLGVAILGSLMGGVQLFGMIKMLGLQKEDMNNTHNEMAWFGYQVSMRILEVTICTLLAVIATTPLRSDPVTGQASPPSASGRRPCWYRCCCCCSRRNPPRELEDEIYSEICSNNQSVRQMMVNGGGFLLDNPYGTLGARMGMNQQMMQMGTISSSAQHLPLTSGGGILMPTRNSATVISVGSSSSNPNSTLRSGTQQDANRASVASSRATLDTALYSNLRSRPSSMLFNDSGFVRFRANGDPGLGQEEVLKQSTHDLTLALAQERNLAAEKGKEGLRASQSFDESVLLVDHRSLSDKLSPASQLPPPGYNPFYPLQMNRQSPIYKSIDDEEGIYEPPPGMKLPPMSKAGIYSESDVDSVDPVYNKSQIYSSRAPSRCSSISATQSFDMRMYGRSAKVGKTQQQQTGFLSTTLKRNEEAKEKLENPYYYYGSTRNQKKLKQQPPQKPRPLLPSQRAQLESQERSRQQQPSRPQSRSEVSRPSSRQALLHQEQQQQQEPQFQRSRSLGGYYNRSGLPPAPPPPVRNQHFFQVQQQPMGSMTPVSYSRWQHAQIQEAGPRRNNPLYDTPPTARHAHNLHMTSQQRMKQGLKLGDAPRYDDALNHHSQTRPQFYPEVRGVMGTSPASQRQQNRLHVEYLLSPILTDQENSPPHVQRRNATAEYLTDEYDDSDMDQFTSQATQGYSEGLADNELESEVSSTVGNDPQGKKSLHLVSPLEYSAMLKLYSQDPSCHSKDITPDSGVVMENSDQKSDMNVVHLRDIRKSQLQPEKQQRKSRQSLLSSSSSLNDLLVAVKRQGDYTRVNTREQQFSSSSGEESDESDCEGEANNSAAVPGKAEKRYHPLVSPPSSECNYPAFRWDGSKILSKGNNDAARKHSSDTAALEHEEKFPEVLKTCQEDVRKDRATKTKTSD